ncbi:hypothetical protein AAV32_10380 [Kerstersia gyiorum]|uniref:Uncharacterized protein n=1 Tax=Kerstersia gyiorum TaxID=206506 RepID=A0A171KRS5_9BURK|nr:hypothetical protein AAV32_10380 [Kerstersia gyiorum]
MLGFFYHLSYRAQGFSGFQVLRLLCIGILQATGGVAGQTCQPGRCTEAAAGPGKNVPGFQAWNVHLPGAAQSGAGAECAGQMMGGESYFRFDFS